MKSAPDDKVNLKELKQRYTSTSKKRKDLPSSYFKDIIEAENEFYSNPGPEAIETLILLYKFGSEFYSTVDKDISASFIKLIQDILMNTKTIAMLGNNPNKKANRSKSIKLEMNLESVDSRNFKPEVKEMMKIFDRNQKNFNDLLKESEEKQKISLKRKIKRKAFRNQVSGDFSMDLRASTHESTKSFVKRIQIKKIKNDSNSNTPTKDSGQGAEKKGFLGKKNTADELKSFLKEYHRKLCYLYQANIEDGILKLNKIVDETNKRRIGRFHEYQGNLKDYLGMGDSFKELVLELENDYIKDMESYNETENIAIENLCKRLAKTKMKDNIAIGNLNMEVIGEIVNLFK